MCKYKNKRKKMKLLFSVLFLTQLHGMNVCDSQNIAMFCRFFTIKNACICKVKKDHSDAAGDKEISPRSTLNVLVKNSVLPSDNDSLENGNTFPLKLEHLKKKQKSSELKITIKEQ